MSKRRNWKILFEDMLECINNIESYTEGMGRRAFLEDQKTSDAVVRNLEIIGEAANKLPNEIRKKYNFIPWNNIIGLRNRVIHGYFSVDLDIVWFIVQNELGTLKDCLEKGISKR